MKNNEMTRRSFIGSVAAATVFPNVAIGPFIDLRGDKGYTWKYPSGTSSKYCPWGCPGKEMVRRFMMAMDYYDQNGILDEFMRDLESKGHSLVQHPIPRRLVSERPDDAWWWGPCAKIRFELEIRVTRDWMAELRKRHKYDRMEMS